MNLLIGLVGFVLSLTILLMIYNFFIRKVRQHVVTHDFLDKIPTDCTDTMKIEQVENGLEVGYYGFTRSKLKKPNGWERLTMHTIHLTGLISYLLFASKERFSNMNFQVLSAPSYQKPTFLMRIDVDGGTAYLRKGMSYGDDLGKFSMANDNPSDTFVEMGLKFTDDQKKEAFLELVHEYCNEHGLSPAPLS